MVQTIMRRPAVEKATGLGRTSIYELISEGKFPKPIRLSRQSVGWLETEIADWQRARIAERDGRRLSSNMEAAA